MSHGPKLPPQVTYAEFYALKAQVEMLQVMVDQLRRRFPVSVNEALDPETRGSTRRPFSE